MLDETGRPPYIQRCTYTEVHGRRHWQCLLQDPHPESGHQLPIDARFGQPIHEMHPEKVAGLLRDQVAVADQLQRRLDELQAHALRLAHALAELSDADEIPEDTRRWVADNRPTAAFCLGWVDDQGVLL